MARDGSLTGLEALAGAAPAEARVTIMIHGYRHAPDTRGGCPHREIYALEPNHPAIPSWSRALGLDAPDRAGIGFGWPALGTLHGAYARAGRAGAALARLVDGLHRVAPRVRVTLIGHSLGARVALQALPGLDPGAVETLILLAGAEFRASAEAAADSPAGRAAQIVNVTSAENRAFDVGLALALAAGAAPTIGRGLAQPRGNWTDLPLHDGPSLAALAALGHPVAPPVARVCHWSTYTRPGALPLYRALAEGSLPVPALRAALPPKPEAQPAAQATAQATARATARATALAACLPQPQAGRRRRIRPFLPLALLPRPFALRPLLPRAFLARAFLPRPSLRLPFGRQPAP